MSRRLLVLNLLFLVAAAAAGAYIVRELTAPPPRPLTVRATPSAGPASATAQQAATPPSAMPASYGVVASRNLFSPTRTEAPPTPVQAQRPAPPLVKPSLQGVVIRDGPPVAFLEDPTTKRVAGYHIGDSIAGGTVQAIHEDRVVLARPDGPVDVRLRDPSKPRPVSTTAPGGVARPPAQMIQQPPPPGMDATQSPPGTSQPPALAQPPQPNAPGFPQRRLPPSILRRIPPSSTDAAQQ